jgi:hypothetical protein
VSLSLGRTAEAHDRNEQALLFARETGMRFMGPYILALKARMESDPIKRDEYRAEGQALLDQGGFGHSPIGYHRLGIEDTLARGEWERTREHATALESYTSNEPLPYTDLLIARGRALAALGENSQDASARSELLRLKAEAQRCEMADRLARPLTTLSCGHAAVIRLSHCVFEASRGCNMRAPSLRLFPIKRIRICANNSYKDSSP